VKLRKIFVFLENSLYNFFLIFFAQIFTGSVSKQPSAHGETMGWNVAHGEIMGWNTAHGENKPS